MPGSDTCQAAWLPHRSLSETYVTITTFMSDSLTKQHFDFLGEANARAIVLVGIKLHCDFLIRKHPELASAHGVRGRVVQAVTQRLITRAGTRQQPAFRS